MIHNDVLRSIRFMLKINDSALAAIAGLGGSSITAKDLSAFLKREDELGYQQCPEPVMAQFLDGLIIHQRGVNQSGVARAPEKTITNNTVLKKLRVAFQLKEEDLLTLMQDTGFQISRPELSALFRNPTHHNYRPCGDQILRNFLKALTGRIREPT